MGRRGRPTNPRTSPIGLAIEEGRGKYTWSVRDLSIKAGVPYKTLSKLELGQVLPRHPERIILKIAKALDVHPDKLLILASLTPMLRPAKDEKPPQEKSTSTVLELIVTEDERRNVEKYLGFLRYTASIEELRLKAEKEMD